MSHIPLVAPLRGLPALALLALLVAHHVEVPLLAISVAATTNKKKSTCDASFVRRPGAVVENVLEILLDPFRLGCGCLVHTFPPHTYFAWEEEKERGELVGSDAATTLRTGAQSSHALGSACTSACTIQLDRSTSSLLL